MTLRLHSSNIHSCVERGNSTFYTVFEIHSGTYLRPRDRSRLPSFNPLQPCCEVKCTLVQALRHCIGCTAHSGSRGIALLFLEHGTRRGEGSASRPSSSLPPGNTRYPLYRRLGGPQGRSGQVRKISPPPGFHPRTVQPVASRYTDYATRPRYSRAVTLTKSGLRHTDFFPIILIINTDYVSIQY
jgi:hypothetical protein